MAAAFPMPLSTIVKNTSGAKRFFGYLGNHGKLLDSNEVFVEHGDLLAKLSPNRMRRQRSALTYDLQNSNLAFIQTPQQLETDGAGGNLKALTITGAAAAIATPDFSTETVPT